MELLSEECREKGNACMKEEKYIEAMFHYTHGVKLEPNNAYLYSNRSLAFLRMQQYHHALNDAKTAIKLMPKWVKGYYRKAEIECAAEHYKEAVESYKQGLAVRPDEKSLMEGLTKATQLYQAQRRADGRMPWYGLALGCVIGTLLVVFDEAITKKPVFQNDTIRCLVIGGIIGICYLIAVMYRYFVQSQRASLLDAPPDLLADALGDIIDSKPSSTAGGSASSQEKPAKEAKSGHGTKTAAATAHQRKKPNH
jgi:tetratricopeptide (TPR) repeat protein